ncbi:MAG: DNA translocase FtsK 4TM domain-containing protein, partial [Actinomycetota bacterium]
MPSPAKKAPSRRRASSGEMRRSHDEVDPSTKFRVVQGKPVLKPILAERAGELMGMLFMVLGVLLSLSVYVSVVGPVGRGLDTGLRWTVGLGRYVLPVVCLGLGIALLKRVSIEHRVRLTFGWLVVSVALLGVLHVFLAANELEISLGALEGAGGWLGWLVGQPLESSLSPIGAGVILAPTIVLGLMLATGKSLPDLVRAIAGLFKKVDDAARRYREGGDAPYDVETDTNVVAGVDDLEAARREHEEAAARGNIYDHNDDGDFATEQGTDGEEEPRQRKSRLRVVKPKHDSATTPSSAKPPKTARGEQ